MNEKLQKIILPYFLISIFFFVVFSFLYWFVDEFFDIDDQYLGFWGPAIVSGLFVWFVIRKKIRQLKITERHKSFLYLSSWVLLAAPVIAFTFFLHRANGKITYLQNPEEIFDKPKTLYYQIKHSEIDKTHFGFSVDRSAVDRGNVIAVSCYFVCPLLNIEKQLESNQKIWIGKLIGERFSNRVFDDKSLQRDLINNFVDSSYYQFKDHKFQTAFLKRLSFSEENNYKQSLKNIGIQTDNVIILREESGTYETRTGSSLNWTVALLIISNVVWFLSTIFEKMKK